MIFSHLIMIKRSRLKEDKNIQENIIKDLRNLKKKLKTETSDTTIKGIRNLFQLQKRE